MKVLVTGANGQLGYDVVKRLKSNDIECLGTDINDFDITDENQVRTFIKSYSPDVVIHCAAYTAVDKAEDEKELCYKINVAGTKYIARVCKEIDAKLVYISTDYVFDGRGDQPFKVTDKPDPVNYYGRTKYEGELAVQDVLDKYFIVRISWVFGINGNNFVKTMLRLGKERGQVSVVNDQVGSPTYTYDLAEVLPDMIRTEKYGIYHITNRGFCSWYEFACEIFRQAGMDVKVTPINTDEYPTKAKRPHNSRFATAGFEIDRSWKDALKDFINNYIKSEKE